MIDEYLDWEEHAAQPSLSAIEAAVLQVRRQLSERLAVVAMEDQDAAQPIEAPLCPDCGEADALQRAKRADRRKPGRHVAFPAGGLPLCSLS